jgi:hypothetical protein
VVGVTNVPAATVCALVIVVFGRWKVLASLEHESALAGVAVVAAVAASATSAPIFQMVVAVFGFSNVVMPSLPFLSFRSTDAVRLMPFGFLGP